MDSMPPLRLLVVSLALLAAACTGPRSILHSPEATPKGDWRLGGGMDVNFPTQTSKALYGGLEGGVDLLYSRFKGSDTVIPITADSLNDLTRALIAYSIDPLGTQPTLFVRYGAWKRMDAGYRFAGGVHAFDARYQFLGPVAGAGAAGGDTRAWQGSLAVQYSSQSYELPSILGKLQSILKYEFNRKDILVPIVFGKPIGADGRFGSFGMGAAYNLAMIEYDSKILKLVEKLDSGAVRPFEDLRGERSVHSFGGFANARLGYRHVHVLASMALYKQDYGTFKLFGGETTDLAGWTLTPSLGLEFGF
jgi:hypothetical protein